MSDHIARLLKEAYALKDKGCIYESLTVLYQALDVDESNPDIHFALAEIFDKAKRTSGAITEFRWLTTWNPESADFHFRLGKALLIWGEQDAAIQEFEKTLELEPGHFTADYYLVQAQESLQRKKAYEDLQHKEAKQDIQRLKEDLRRNSEDFRGHKELADALRKVGQPSEAAVEFREAVRLAPPNPNLHFHLGRTLRDIGNLSGAVVEFREAILLAPQDPAWHFWLGLALHKLGNLTEAIAAFRNALRLNFGEPAINHNELGFVLLKQGLVNEAILEFERAIIIHPDYPEAYFGLGSAMYQLGQTAKAVRLMREALSFNHEMVEVERVLAQISA